MPRFAFLILALLGLLAGLDASAEALPRPQALEPNVRFWLRVFSEIDAYGGLIHDNQHLDVVYETIRFPQGLSPRERERRVEQAKRRYQAVLQQLATGKRTGLTAEAQRVLALWPEGTSNATLRTATLNVRFQLGQADKFRAGLIRSKQWRAHIEQVLAEHGVPTELVALPHVESSYNPRAYSHVGAAGIWQFMRSTGRIYLRVDDVVDERMDPHKASIAAARLLAFNYRQIDSWPLAITAYNHGLAGMTRAVRSLGTRDIGKIVRNYRSRSFGFASRNFYAELLAVSEIDRDPDRFFGPLVTLPPLEHAIVKLDHYYKITSLQRALGIDLETLRDHNLALRPPVWSGAKYVPRGYELRVPANLVTQPIDQVIASIAAGERLSEQHRDRFYKVRRGDTLSKIAQRQSISERELSELNNLRNRHSIRLGQVLRLPDHASSTEPAVVALVEPMPTDRIHRVRRGETLTSIARRYGVTEAEIAAANRLTSRNLIGVGQRLRLPGAPEPQPTTAPEPAILIAKTEAAPAAVLPAPEGSPPIVPAPPSTNAPEPVVPAAEETKPSSGEEAKPSETPEPAPPGAPAPVPAVVAVAVAPPPQTALASEPAASASPDPSNYSVSKGDRVTIQAGETLGHYAEWLEVRPSALRRQNRMKAGAPLVIGHTAKLDFSRVTPEVFEARRLSYHLALQEAFFEAYFVSGTETHVLSPGDTLWYLANKKLRVPEWLLRQYNPDLDFGALRVGTSLVVPVIEPRQS